MKAITKYGKIMVVITTGSNNIKTGDMNQHWIIRNDISPLEAKKTGKDDLICGDCPHRNGTCYVCIFQAPQSIFRAFKRGSYEGKSVNTTSKYNRLGAYGDPAFIPFEHWENVLKDTDKHTGYTHRWNKGIDNRFKGIVMASVDNKKELLKAKKEGWSTFRILAENENKEPFETVCLSVSKDIQCKDCLICRGSNGKHTRHMVVPVHGNGKGNFGK